MSSQSAEDDALSARWRSVAGAYPEPLASLARQIAARDSNDFEKLWLMADFAQLSIRYSALLLLAFGYHHEPSRKFLFRAVSPADLHRASLGKWVQFLREAVAPAKQGLVSHNFPFDELVGLSAGSFERIGTVVEERNVLAHGALGRFKPTRKDVQDMSALVLSIADEFRDTLSRRLTRQTDGFLHWPAANNLPSAVCLHPFILAGPSDDTLLFSKLDRKRAMFEGSLTQTVVRDVAGTIADYLTDRFPARREAVAGITEANLRARSFANIDMFKRLLNDDVFVRERYFRDLSRFAGRPTFADHFCGEIEGAQQPQAIHLFGRRGMGKGIFLADVMTRLWESNHVVAITDESNRVNGDEEAGVLDASVRGLNLSGTLIQLAQAVARMRPDDRRLRLVVVIPDLDVDEGTSENVQQVTNWLTNCAADLPVTLVMVSHSDGDGAGWSGEPQIRQMAFPPMETAAAADFFDRVTARRAHAPLTSWDELPAGAYELTESPADLVTLCLEYRERAIDERFHVPHYRRERWKQLVESKEAETVAAIARAMRTAQARHVSRAVLTIDDRDIELMQRAGYIVADRNIRFAEFEWLANGLTLTITDAELTGKQLNLLLDEVASYPPLGDALAEYLARVPAEVVSGVFTAMLARPIARARFTQALLSRALPHNRRLYDELVELALATRESEVVLGVAAAAQQFVDSGPEHHELDGLELYTRCLAVASQAELRDLEAAVTLEFALDGLATDDVAGREKAFLRCIELSRLLPRADLELIASNHLAALQLAAIRRDTPRPGQLDAIIERLTAVRVTADRTNWIPVMRTETLLAEACSAIGNYRSAADHAECAMNIAGRFGAFDHRAGAAQTAAEVWARLGDVDRAIESQTQAVAFARIAARPLDEAALGLGLARHLVAKAASSSDDRASLGAAAMKSCHSARRALQLGPQDADSVRYLNGRISRAMAELVFSFGEKRTAVGLAERAMREFQSGNGDEAAEALRRWVESLQLDDD